MTMIPTLNPRRIDRARLAANMSHADLAFAIRRVTDGRLKPSEQSVRRWIAGKHAPREGVLGAIAAATGQELGFFYEPDGGDDDEEDEEALLRDLGCLDVRLRRRVEDALASARALAGRAS